MIPYNPVRRFLRNPDVLLMIGCRNFQRPRPVTYILRLRRCGEGARMLNSYRKIVNNRLRKGADPLPAG